MGERRKTTDLLLGNKQSLERMMREKAATFDTPQKTTVNNRRVVGVLELVREGACRISCGKNTSHVYDTHAQVSNF